MRTAVLPITIGPQTPNRDLPIIDAHHHLNGNMSGERLLRLMDDAGVRRRVSMALAHGLRRLLGRRPRGGRQPVLC